MKILRLYFLINCSTWFLLSHGEWASAATYYVSPDGSDSGVGTTGDPFKTIQKAADIVNPEDTVIVKNGIYTDTNEDDSIVRLERGGTSDNWVTFKSENKWGAVLDGRNNTTRYGWVFGAGANYVRVENFDIKGCTAAGVWSNSGAHHVSIYGNNIHHMGRRCTDTEYGQGIGAYQGTGTSFHTYDSNMIHDNGRFATGENGCRNTTHYWQNHDHGLYLRGINTSVVNNIFYNHKAGWSIQYDLSQEISNDKIIHNVFAFSNINRRGHILVNTYGDGYFNIIIQNNIFYKPRGYAISKYSSSGVINMVVQNNLVYGANLVEDQTGYVSLTVKNNIKGLDPLFVGPFHYDFHLLPDSPAIDAGTGDIINIPYDFDGNSRPRDSGYDIGAYEYISE